MQDYIRMVRRYKRYSRKGTSSSIIFANNQYSVITKASSKGLEIASPNEGWKFTEYENIANEFEEEIKY